MALSSDLVSQFVKATKDEKEPVKETIAYGKIVVKDGKEYVKLDGSDLLTPVSSTTVVKDEDRVMVTIKNHTAIVTGDLTNPSASNKDVSDIGNQITEFEIVISDKVVTEDLEAINAYIENIKGVTAKYEELEAITAEIETLQAKYATMEHISAKDAEILNAEIESLRGKFAEFTNISTQDLEAINAELTNLIAYNASFTYVSAEKLDAIDANIKNLQTNKLDAETAKITYATIDFANINEAAVEKLFTDSGIIKDLIMSDGKVTGELVGVTIKGDIIEGNTVKADKLVILGEDGLYYKLNVDALGETTASSDEKYQNGLDGSVIIAESITAEKIAVDDLVAFGATIGGFKINNHAIYSGVKNSMTNTTPGIHIADDGQINIGDQNNFFKYYIDENGQYKLEIQADSLRFGANNTTIEEYINELDINVDAPEAIKEIDTIGRDLEITDGKQIIDFTIEGKSEQEVRSGKNLLEMTDGTYTNKGVTAVVKNGIITLNGTATENSFIHIPIKNITFDNRDYTLSANNTASFGEQTTGTWAGIRLHYNDDTDSSSMEFYYVNVHGVINNNKTATAFVIRTGSGLTLTNYVIKPQLELGSTYTEWEQGGVSPSPDYPSEIKSIGYENLFNKEKFSYATGWYNDSGTFTDSTMTQHTTMKIPVKPNTTYNISGYDISYDANYSCYKIYYYDKNYDWISRFNVSSANQVFTTPSDCYYIDFQIVASYESYVKQRFFDILDSFLLLEGSKKKLYVPYGKTGVEVVHHGKNIFNYRGPLSSYAGITAVLNDDETITVTGVPTRDYVTVRNEDITDKLEDGATYWYSLGENSYKVSMQLVTTDRITGKKAYYGNGSNNGGKNKFVADTKKYIYDMKIITCRVANWGTESLTVTNTYQIEKGDEVTKFEPYFWDTTTFVINEPLRSLPNGVKDVAYLQNGKLRIERNVGSKTFNGSEKGDDSAGWNLYEQVGSTLRRFGLKDNTVPQDLVMMANNFKCESFAVGPVTDLTMWTQATYWAISDANGKWADAAAFRSWMADNNLKVIYELSSPVIEEYDETYEIPMHDEYVDVYLIDAPVIPYKYCRYYTIYAGIDGKDAYQLWLEAGNTGTEEDFLNAQKLTNKASGTPLIIEDGAGVIEFLIEGKTEQTTRSGKNLFDYVTTFKSTNKGLTNKINADGSITVSGLLTGDYASITTMQDITNLLEDGQKYTAQQSTPSTKVFLEVRAVNISDGTVKSYYGAQAGSVTFTVDKSLYTYDTRVVTSTKANWGEESQTITSFYQIEKGSTKTAFEPCGKSPSPDFPSEIRSVGYTNIFDGEYELGSINSSGATTTSTNCVRTKNFHNVYPSTVYTLQYSIEATGLAIYQYDQNKNFICTSSPSVITRNGVRYSIFMTRGNAYYLKWRHNTGFTTLENQTQLESGSLMHPYVPHKTSGVEVVNDNSNNLFDYSHIIVKSAATLTGTAESFTLTNDNSSHLYYVWDLGIIDSDIYYFDYISNVDCDSGIGCIYVSQDGTWTGRKSIQNLYRSANNYSKNLSAYRGYHLFLMFRANTPDIYTTQTITNLVVSRRPITKYELYNRQSVMLPIKEPLRSYTDGTKDIAYVKNGRLYVNRQLSSVVLTGVEGWYYNTTYSRFDEDFKDLPGAADHPIISDYFKYNGTNSVGGWVNNTTSYLQVRIKDPRFTTTSELKAWLTDHPTTYVYKLKTPYTEDLGPAFIPMHETLDDIYYVSDDLEPQLECEYHTEYAASIAGVDNSIYQQILIQKTEILEDAGEIVSKATETLVTRADFNKYTTETAVSQMKQTAEDVTIQFNKEHQITDKIGDLEEDYEDLMENKIDKYFKFDADGMTIGSGSKAMKLRLDNEEGIIFENANGERVGYWDGNNFYTGNIVVRVDERAQFGNYAYEPKPDGSLMFNRVK